MIEKNDSGYFTTQEIADLFEVNVSTIKRWVDKGYLEAEKTPGNHRRITRNQIMEFIDSYPQYDAKSYVIRRLQEHAGDVDEDDRQAYAKALKAEQYEEAFEVVQHLFVQSTSMTDILDCVVLPVLQELEEAFVLDDANLIEANKQIIAIRTHLSSLLNLLPESDSGKTAIVACVPRDYYDVPLVLFELVLRQHGWKVVNLGINVSTAHMKEAAHEHNAQLMCLSQTRTSHYTLGCFHKISSFADKEDMKVAYYGLGWSNYLKRKANKLKHTRYINRFEKLEELIAEK